MGEVIDFNTGEVINSKYCLERAQYWREQHFYAKEFYYHNMGAEQGCPKCLYKVGISYLFGHSAVNDAGMRANIKKSIKYLILSAEKGNDKSYHWLGSIYYKGYRVKPDLNKALFYYKKAPVCNSAIIAIENIERRIKNNKDNKNDK